MKLTIKELQKLGTQMLRVVVGIMEEENIPYSLLFGSMIGIIRHHGPIPWDYDIDLGIPEPELPRFVEVMKRRLPEDYWLDYDKPGLPLRSLPRIGLKGYDTRFFHIDIYRVVGFPEKKWKQKLYVRRCKLLISLRCAKVYTYTSKKKKRRAALVRAMTFMIPADFLARRFDKLCRKYPYEGAGVLGTNTVKDLKQDLLPPDFFDTCKMPYVDFEASVSKRYDEILRLCYGDYMQFPPEQEQNRGLNGVYRIEPLQ